MYRADVPALQSVANNSSALPPPAPAIARNAPLDGQNVIAVFKEVWYRFLGYQLGTVTGAELADAIVRGHFVVREHVAAVYPDSATPLHAPAPFATAMRTYRAALSGLGKFAKPASNRRSPRA